MSGKLFFCIGLPRSGKSTYCDQWVHDAELDKQTDWTWNGQDERAITTITGVKHPRVVVGGDDYRLALYGRHFHPQAEAVVFSMMDVSVRALLSRGFDVIVDETCTTEQTLLRYLRNDIDATPVWIDTPIEECKRRAVETGKEFLLGPIDRLHTQLRHLKFYWNEIYPRCREQVIKRREQDISV